MQITEEWLYFLWEEVLPALEELKTTDNKNICILSPGFRNISTGPDYFNARIEIDHIQWAGNVEIHVKTSDWKKHHHHYDTSYTNIILHVVWENDESISGSGPQNIFLLELKNFISPDHLNACQQWVHSGKGTLPCSEHFIRLNEMECCSWLEKMSVERLEERVNSLKKKFEFFNYDWNQLLYTLLLEAFGFHVNSIPCFQLSARVPLSVMLKECDSLFRLDTLLLGASGLVYEMPHGSYRHHIIQEYEFLKEKYSLENMSEHTWKCSGIRPANHPVVRMLQFSRMFFRLSDTFRNFHPDQEGFSVRDFLNDMFNPEDFRQEEINIPLPGNDSKKLIILNGWSLFYFFYGLETGQDFFRVLAVEMQQSLSPEKNFKTRLFSRLPLKKSSAFLTQGMIHLFNSRCRKKMCMECYFGRKIMKQKIL